MPKQFIPGRRYKFSKDKWLTDTGNVLLYQGNPYLRQVVDEADGKEVEKITEGSEWGQIGKLVVYPDDCDIVESKSKTAFRQAVDRLHAMDRAAQLHEVINMLASDKKRLERRLGAINKELAHRERELYEVERELMKWTSS